MDQSIRLRTLAEKWRNAEFEGRTHLGANQAGPAPKIFQHFATEAERQQHLQNVAHAQQNNEVQF